MQCLICRKDIKSKRKDARFCSAGCRVATYRSRKRNVTDKQKDEIKRLKRELSIAGGLIREQQLEIEALTRCIKAGPMNRKISNPPEPVQP